MLDKLLKWLSKPAPTLLDKVMFGFAGFALSLVWFFFLIHFLDYIHAQRFGDHPEYWVIFFACIFAPLWEELAFRVIPMQYAKNLGPQYIIPTLFLSSLIFGWGHGQGPISLLIQGVGGFILGVAYIKTNYNYWVPVAMHSAWNIWAIFIAQ